MAKVKLSLSKLSVPDKVALGRLIVTQMTGNANFTTPAPTLASVTTQLDALETSAATQDASKQAAIADTAAMDSQEDVVDTILTNLANWAQGHVSGDGDKLLSAGFTLQGQGAPTQVTQVTGLQASPGDDDGEVNFVWDPQQAAVSYEMQTSTNPNDSSLWQHGGIFSKSSATLNGLPSGQRCWWRVRALGTNDQKGAWSDPATKIVP